MKRLTILLATLAALTMGVSVSQDSFPLELDWAGGPNPNTKWLILESGSGRYYTGLGEPYRLTDNESGTYVYWRLNQQEAHSSDGHAVMMTAGPTKQITDQQGILVGIDCSLDMSSTSNKWRTIGFVGTGALVVWETTGGSPPVNTKLPCSSCITVGDEVPGNRYVGFQWEGAGTSFVYRYWFFDQTPPADYSDWTTWGNCDGGVYDEAGATTCTDANFQVTDFDPAYGAGTCLGLVHHDQTAQGTAGFQAIYFSGGR